MSAALPLIDPLLAVNSVIVWLFGVALFASMSWTLFQRGFIRNTYLSDTSSLRFILHRTRLLFILSCLGIVDALNNAIFHYLVWQFNSYPSHYFWVHRTTSTLLFPLLLPAGVLALSYRCASIITSNQQWRDRYIMFATVISASASVVQVSGGFAMMLAQKDLSPAMQISPLTRWFSPWGNYGQIILPALAIVGSTLSIQKVAAQRKRKRAVSLRLLARFQRQHDVTGAQQKPNCTGGVSTPISSTATHTSDVTASQPQYAMMNASPPSLTTSKNNNSPIKSMASSSSIGRATYPLTLSFQALNVLVLINWTSCGLLTAVQVAGQVRIQAWLSVLIALSVASEASFERLTKYYNRRRGAKAAAIQAQALDQDGDQNESMFRGIAMLDPGRGDIGGAVAAAGVGGLMAGGAKAIGIGTIGLKESQLAVEVINEES